MPRSWEAKIDTRPAGLLGGIRDPQPRPVASPVPRLRRIRVIAAKELQCTTGVPAHQRRLMKRQRGGFCLVDPDVAGGGGGRAEKSALSIESGRTDRLGHVVSVLWWHWSRRCIR